MSPQTRPSSLTRRSPSASPYKSEPLAAAHEPALGLGEAGVMPRKTMRLFDEMCLTPVEVLSPEEVRAFRLQENRSGGVRAVSQRERGAGKPVGAGKKRPRGASLQVLALVAKSVLAPWPESAYQSEASA